MPEHIRALIVIIFLAAVVFAFSRRPASELIGSADFTRRRNLWFALTLVAFLVHNFWLYALVAATALLVAGRREQNRVALFFLLLFLIPNAPAQIPGFGIINYLFALNHVRLLTLAVLLPAFLLIRQRADTLPFGRIWADRFLTGYLLLVFALYMRETTFFDTLRQGFYLFIDVFLPYYVVSRSLKSIEAFRDALLGFVLAAMVLAAIGFFEFMRHWLLYSALIDALGLNWNIVSYLTRSDLLRASATTGQAIALGYVMAVALGFCLYLKDEIGSRLSLRLGGLLLAAGLIAPLSRGPWVGFAAMLAIYLSTGQHALRRLAMLVLAVIVALPILAVLPGGQKVIDLLPFIGATEKSTIDYRERLFDSAMVIIDRNPWFGSVNYLEEPEMRALMGGQGIIDIVNTYIRVALETGYVGLGLFSGFFVLVLLGLHKAMRSLPDKDDETYGLGRALFATLTGILVIIFTVSSISIIPVVYWSVAGLGVAYAQMVRTQWAKEAAI